VLYLGQTQTFYNSTSGSITLSTPVGDFVGPTVSGSSMVMPVGSVAVLASDGVNYILADFFGGAISAQGTVTLSPAGTTVTISPTGTGANLTMSPAGTGALTPVGALTLGTAGQTETHRGNIVATTSNQTVTLSPTGTGTVTISPAGTVTISPAGALTINPTAASTINNTSIGNITAAAGTFTDLTATGWTTLTEVTEVLNTKTGATGVVVHDLATGAIFYHSSVSANFTANFTNVPTTTNRVITVSLIIVQGATGRYPNAVQIDGAAQPINWAGNVLPTPSVSRTDVVSFTLIRTGSSWSVLGSLGGY
jgi:hypothetical protein